MEEREGREGGERGRDGREGGERGWGEREGWKRGRGEREGREGGERGSTLGILAFNTLRLGDPPLGLAVSWLFSSVSRWSSVSPL